MQQAAEHVYEVTQPYRYANYLDRNYDPEGLADRVARAAAIYRKLIAGDDPGNGPGPGTGWAPSHSIFTAINRKSSAYYLKAIASTPDFTIGYFALASRDRPWTARKGTGGDFQTASSRLLHRDRSRPQSRLSRHARSVAQTAISPACTGDFAAAIPICQGRRRIAR